LLEIAAVVSFCLAFFAGGYCLGRLANPAATWFDVDPDPLREEAEVISIHAARSRLAKAKAS
jgi:hypothetical protein